MPRAFLARTAHKPAPLTTQHDQDDHDNVVMVDSSLGQPRQVSAPVNTAEKTVRLSSSSPARNQHPGNDGSSEQRRPKLPVSVLRESLWATDLTPSLPTTSPQNTSTSQTSLSRGRSRGIDGKERLLMREWLEQQLEKGDIPGFQWQDKKAGIFKIPWLHAARQGWAMGKDALLFQRWAEHTGKLMNGGDPETLHKRWKANFRCAINSLPDVKEMKEATRKKGINATKVYRFLTPVIHRKSSRKVSQSQNMSQKKPMDLSVHNSCRRKGGASSNKKRDSLEAGTTELGPVQQTFLVEGQPMTIPILLPVTTVAMCPVTPETTNLQLPTTPVTPGVIAVSSLTHSSGSIMIPGPVGFNPALHPTIGQVSHPAIGQVSHPNIGQVSHPNIGQVSHPATGQLVITLPDAALTETCPEIPDGNLIIDERTPDPVEVETPTSNQGYCNNDNNDTAPKGKLVIDIQGVTPEGRSISMWRENPNTENMERVHSSRQKNKAVRRSRKTELTESSVINLSAPVTTVSGSAENAGRCNTPARTEVRFIPEKQGSVVIKTNANYVRCSVDKPALGLPTRPTNIRIVQKNRKLPQPWNSADDNFSDYLKTMEKLTEQQEKVNPPANVGMQDGTREVTDILNIPIETIINQEVAEYFDSQPLDADCSVPLDLTSKSKHRTHQKPSGNSQDKMSKTSHCDSLKSLEEMSVQLGQVIKDCPKRRYTTITSLLHGTRQERTVTMTATKHVPSSETYESERNVSSSEKSEVNNLLDTKQISCDPTPPAVSPELSSITSPCTVKLETDDNSILLDETSVSAEKHESILLDETSVSTVKQETDDNSILLDETSVSTVKQETDDNSILLDETTVSTVKHQSEGDSSPLDETSISESDEDSEDEPQDETVMTPSGRKVPRLSFTLPYKKRSPVVITGRQVKRNVKLTQLKAPHYLPGRTDQNAKTLGSNYNPPEGGIVMHTESILADHCYTVNLAGQPVLEYEESNENKDMPVGSPSRRDAAGHSNEVMFVVTSQNVDGSFSQTFLCMECRRSYVRGNMVMRRVAEGSSGNHGNELHCHVCNKTLNIASEVICSRS